MRRRGGLGAWRTGCPSGSSRPVFSRTFTVTGNRRMTFKFEGEHAVLVDTLDYH